MVDGEPLEGSTQGELNQSQERVRSQSHTVADKPKVLVGHHILRLNWSRKRGLESILDRQAS